VVAALGVAVLIATATLLRATMHDRKAPARREPSIAVLPLANVSRNSQDAALVDGLRGVSSMRATAHDRAERVVGIRRD
jgi:hypothetical protein